MVEKATLNRYRYLSRNLNQMSWSYHCSKNRHHLLKKNASVMVILLCEFFLPGFGLDFEDEEEAPPEGFFFGGGFDVFLTN
jgi:hypothetical protein